MLLFLVSTQAFGVNNSDDNSRDEWRQLIDAVKAQDVTGIELLLEKGVSTSTLNAGRWLARGYHKHDHEAIFKTLQTRDRLVGLEVTIVVASLLAPTPVSTGIVACGV